MWSHGHPYAGPKQMIEFCTSLDLKGRTEINAKHRGHCFTINHLKLTFTTSVSSCGGCYCVCVYYGNQRQAQSDCANMAAVNHATKWEEWKKASRMLLFIRPVMQIKICFFSSSTQTEGCNPSKPGKCPHNTHIIQIPLPPGVFFSDPLAKKGNFLD